MNPWLVWISLTLSDTLSAAAPSSFSHTEIDATNHRPSDIHQPSLPHAHGLTFDVLNPPLEVYSSTAPTRETHSLYETIPSKHVNFPSEHLHSFQLFGLWSTLSHSPPDLRCVALLDRPHCSTLLSSQSVRLRRPICSDQTARQKQKWPQNNNSIQLHPLLLSWPAITSVHVGV